MKLTGKDIRQVTITDSGIPARATIDGKDIPLNEEGMQELIIPGRRATPIPALSEIVAALAVKIDTLEKRVAELEGKV